MIRPRMRRTFVRSLMLLLLSTQVGCAALRRPGPVVDRSQDARIQGDVQARIDRQPALGGGNIRVEVDGAVVVLHGSVQGIAAWQCAIRTAQLVQGVRTVSDYLVIEPGPRRITCLDG
jgi:osmotically-inducible protein OsmY